MQMSVFCDMLKAEVNPMNQKEPLLISACLLGVRCRFDGKEKPLPEETLTQLAERFSLIPVCPEQLGGLCTPRTPTEFDGSRFYMQSGEDVTEQFLRGAAETCRLARMFGIKRALLKEKSPSCGFGAIYDGSFQKRLTQGNGATANALSAMGIEIFGESRIEEL